MPLPLFHNKEKLKCLLTGYVLIECSSDPTLTLDDFAINERISNKATACPSNNAGLVAAIKNFQVVMQIVFSDAFATSLEVFIDHLEGVKRPMEVVPADFLRYSVELTLRKFFRIVRTVKGSALSDCSVKTPEQCAALMSSLFVRLAADLSDSATMLGMESYYRVRTLRKRELDVLSVNFVTPAKSGRQNLEKQSVKFSPATPIILQSQTSVTEEKSSLPSKPCSGHLGSQLAAVRKDGRPYACSHGKECTYRHISVAGKSNQKLLDIVASMPVPVRADLKKAIEDRK